jgi:hypothetical protein
MKCMDSIMNSKILCLLLLGSTMAATMGVAERVGLKVV